VIPRPSLLALKAGFGATGLGVGLVGMALETRWLVWVAVALVGVAFLLRFAGGRREPSDPEGLAQHPDPDEDQSKEATWQV
jgi:hypothetical protein